MKNKIAQIKLTSVCRSVKLSMQNIAVRSLLKERISVEYDDLNLLNDKKRILKKR